MNDIAALAPAAKPSARDPKTASRDFIGPAAVPAKGSAQPAVRPAVVTAHVTETTRVLALDPSKIEADDRTGRYLIGGTLAATVATFLISRRGYYTPGDDVGYYLGLVGGVIMLLLLTYPLRKYLHSFRNWGVVRHWFSFHMIMGVVGPVLVLAHSKIGRAHV